MSKVSKFSESEDDPDPFEDSGEEWDEVKEEKTKAGNRRKSSRLSKKPRLVHDSDSEGVPEPDDEDFDVNEVEDDEPKPKKARNGVAKKVRVSSTTDEKKTEEPKAKSDKEENVTVVSSSARIMHRKFIPKTITCKNYSTGSFVINKKDAQKGDPKIQPCIWRIDGKALLQKYEPIEVDGKVRHKNTSVYTGWSPMDVDIYAPITVDVVEHNNHNLTVEVHWDDLKKIDYESE